MALSTKSKQQAVWEGEALTFLCKADGAKSPLSVEWWHFPQSQTQPELVAGMEQDGTVQLGTSYKEHNNHGNTRLEKIDWATFQLEIAATAVTDSGTYECWVSERSQNQARDWSWTQRLTVTVKSLGKCPRSPSLMLRIVGTFLCRGMQWNLIVGHPEPPQLGHTHPRAQCMVSGCHVR